MGHYPECKYGEMINNQYLYYPGQYTSMRILLQQHSVYTYDYMLPSNVVYSSPICALYRHYTVLAIAYSALYTNMIIREE